MQEQFKKAQQLRDNGNIDEAIKLYDEVRHSALDQGDTRLAAECLHMIGVSHYQNDHYKNAEKFLKDAEREFIQQKNDEGVGFVLRDRGLVARGEKRFDEAESLLKESIEKLRVAGNKGHEAISLVKLGTVYREQGKNTEAIDTIREGIRILEETTDTFFLSTAYFDLAKVYASIDKKKLAVNNANKSLEVLNSFSDESKFQQRRKDIMEFLQKCR